MTMRKLKPIVMMVGAIVGLGVLAVAAIKAYKASQGGQTTFWSAFSAYLQAMFSMN